MKKAIAWILLFLLFLPLCACGNTEQNPPLVFYYPWADLEEAMRQDPACTAIASEEREVSGNRDNLRYLLTLYFRGPLDPGLTSPFPSGTVVVNALLEDGNLTVTLSNSFTHLKDMDRTVACVCLAKTCFGLSDAQSVIIETDDPDISITVTRDNYLLEDSTEESTPSE